MPIIKSAKKRVRIAEKAAIRNSKTKRSLKTTLKAFHASITGGKQTTEAQSAAQSSIDKAAKKGLIHKNKAARQKAQLAKISRDASKVAVVASPVKKTAAKKSPTKKPVAKKPATTKKPVAAKKTTAKKPAAKK